MTRVISGKYEEIEKLGQGGQGVVYKVRQTDHQTTLALKAVQTFVLDNPITIGRFEQEALVLTRLRHRNIVRVLGSGRDEALGLIYIVMEYIQGKTLKEYLQERGPLPLPELLNIACQVASALAYAHTQSPPVIHRDIKPTNIMIEDFSGRVVLLDFGIAKELDETSESQTRTGFMLGTWKYSSPEQLRHEPLTGSADVYSLGMVIYEMYTGRQFFAGLEESVVLGQLLYDSQEHDPTFTCPTPPEFAGLVKKAIAKFRDQRYQSMADLLNDLESCRQTFDEDRTTVLKGLDPVKPSFLPESSPVDATLLQSNALSSIAPDDTEMLRLQEERQRLSILSLQARVKSAREEAEQSGAKQWAEARFEQGRVQEESANAHVREVQYGLAQTTFEEALAFFVQANEETAKAKLRSRAEQARREVETAKSDADRYGAPEYVQTGYDRALTLVGEAETRFRQEAYDDARKLYVDARSRFEDARDLAYRETRREEAKSAQIGASTAREAALREGADTLANVIVEEARRNEQQAAEALERGEFTQASALYGAASQKYEQAQRKAHVEQVQQRVEVAQRAVETARTNATQVQAQEKARTMYERAVTLQEQANAFLQQQSYQHAIACYEEAQRAFDEARESVENDTLREQVLDTKRKTEASRIAAEQADARVYAQEAYRHALQEETQGEEAFGNAQWEKAEMHFSRAQAQFVAAYQGAQLRKKTREAAEGARQAAITAYEAATREQVAELLPDRFAQAQALMSHAEQALRGADFINAQQDFTQAVALFLRLREEASVQAQQLRDAEDRTRVAVRPGKDNMIVAAPPTSIAPTRDTESSERARETNQPDQERAEDATVVAPHTPSPSVVRETPVTPRGASHKSTKSVPVAINDGVPRIPRLQKNYLTIGVVLLALVAGVYLVKREPTATPPLPQARAGSSNQEETSGPRGDRVPTLSPEPSDSNPLPANTSPQPQPFDAKTPTSTGRETAGVSPGEILKSQSVEQTPDPIGTPTAPTQSAAAPPSPTVPTLPVTPVAKIMNVKPAPDENILVDEGRTQSFAITVKDEGSKSLRYDWYVDNAKQERASEKQWTYKPGFDNGRETEKTIKVVMSAGNQALDSRMWTHVTVRDLPRPPQITNPSPQLGKTIDAAFGDELPFSVEIYDPDKLAADLTWFLDGKKVGEGLAQKIQVPSEGDTHTVEVKVGSTSSKKISQNWSIRIPAALPPRIVDIRPKTQAVTTSPGSAVEFALIAEPSGGGREKANVQIEWNVNGEVRQTKTAPQFRFVAEQEGSYAVAATAIGGDGIRSSPKKWTVRVAAVTPLIRSEARSELTKDEVRDWVERYRRAIEQKDSKTLEQLGLSKTEVRDSIDDVKKYDDLVIKVEVRGEDIQLDGQPAKRAKVTFKRSDRRDDRQTPSVDVQYSLEKQADGRVVVAK